MTDPLTSLRGLGYHVKNKPGDKSIIQKLQRKKASFPERKEACSTYLQFSGKQITFRLEPFRKEPH